MQFIEALKLKSKLFFLFILIAIGLVAVGVMGSVNINAMKKNIDSLYFGSLIPVTELNSILQLYHTNLDVTIQRATEGEIDADEASIQIKEDLSEIEKKWKNYKSHFKRDEELPYLEYAALEIKSMNQNFSEVLKYLNEESIARDAFIQKLSKNVIHIESVVQKLINYEVEMAHYERQSLLDYYDKLLLQLLLILLIIIIAILSISYNVIKSIQYEHTKLEFTMKKLKKVNKKLENASYTDALTLLHNRRYFNLIYERELKRAHREKNDITFMMIDIDFFKQYNDTYGHLQGDEALKQVAKTIQDALRRPTDFVFRLGGEEFGVLLVNTDVENSARLAQNILDLVKEKHIRHRNSKVHEFLTISIGVVCCKIDDTVKEDTIISKADKMLYQAKEEGRDRYIMTTLSSIQNV